MRKNIKYSLFLMLLMIVPTFVFAASIDIGSAKNEEGKASWPIVFKGDKLASGDVFKLSTSGNNNSMVTCSIAYSSPLAGSGAVSVDKDVPADGLTIGTLTCQTTSPENQKGEIGIDGTFTSVAGKTDKLSMTPKTYTVNAARAKSSNSKLTSLKPSQGNITPEFKSDTFDYTVYNIKDTIASIRLVYTCDHCNVSSSNQGVTGGGSSSTITVGNLQKGDNKIEIKVTSENGEKNDTYNVNIIRGDTEFDSAKIKSISFGDGELTPEFKSDTYEYSIQVPNSVRDVSKVVSIDLADPTASYEIKDGDALSVGENTVTIIVTSNSNYTK